MTKLLLMATLVVLCGCEELLAPPKISHYHTTIDGMDCISQDYRSMSCDWSTYEGHIDE